MIRLYLSASLKVYGCFPNPEIFFSYSIVIGINEAILRAGETLASILIVDDEKSIR